MKLKENINKIHYNLSENFEKVKIVELENKENGKYFEICTVNGIKELKMQVSFKDLEFQNFKWFYSENPLNEKSDWIERESSADSLTNDIKDIFDRNRFSIEYLEKINK